jgi:hypothetical protein
VVLEGKSVRPVNQLNWTVDVLDIISRYEVEVSANNNQYRKLATLTSNGENSGSYQWIHTNPGGGIRFYRIKGVKSNGQVVYSNVILLGMNAGTAALTVTPNPVTNQGSLNLSISALPTGSYTVVLLNANGVPVSQQVIKHNGTNQIYNFILPSDLPPGLYYIRVVGKGENLVQPVIKQ